MNVFDVIRQHEGFSETAYWDVNHWRVGYGSDTYVDDNGNVRTVTKDTVVTREQAERDLARRVPEFQDTGIKPYLNAGVWERLPESVKIAVTSIAYNYGSISELNTLKNAINTGDLNLIADTIEGYGSHNNGINKSRRKKEADLIRNGPIPPESLPTVASELDVVAGKTGGINLERVLADKEMPIAEKVNLTLDALYTPYPEPRAKGTAARTNAALKKTEPVPMPRNRPNQPGDGNTPVTRLPELGLPSNITARAEEILREEVPQSQIERNPPEVVPGQSLIERTSARASKPGQSQIERNDMTLTTPAPDRGMNLKEMIASDISRNKPTPVSTSGKSAAASRAEALAEQREGKPTQRPGQSQIERNAPAAKPVETKETLGNLTLRTPTGVELERQERALLASSDAEKGYKPPTRPTPKKEPGVTRVAGGLAGQVALPADVRPLIPSTEITRLPEILPGGSNPKGVGVVTTVGDDNYAYYRRPGSAQANIESAKREQQATRQNLERIAPVESLKLVSPTKAAAEKAKAGERIVPLAPTETAGVVPKANTSTVPSKHKSAPEASSLNDAVTDMMRGWAGIEGRNARETGQQFMGTVTLDGISNYTAEQKSQGYGSKGYSEQYSPGGQRYDSRSGTWEGENKGNAGSKVK